MDILFKNDDFVFSYRVGGILTHNGKILLQRPKNDDYAIIVYNGIKNSSSKIDFCNKKTEAEQKFGFGSFGSPGPVRTDDLPVNSRLLHR